MRRASDFDPKRTFAIDSNRCIHLAQALTLFINRGSPLNNSKLIWLLGSLIFLVTINIGMTAYVAFRPSVVSVPEKSGAVAESVISQASAKDFANGIVSLYNQKDGSGLYAKFDDLARVQFSKEQLAEKLLKLHSLLGNVGEVAFSHAEIAGTNDGRTYYNLLYRVTLVGGQFAHGTMKLTVSQGPSGFSLYGFFLFGGEDQAAQ